jgi:hypothetical protein
LAQEADVWDGIEDDAAARLSNLAAGQIDGAKERQIRLSIS